MKEGNLGFYIRLSTCISARGDVFRVRFLVDMCLFILLYICIKVSNRINVTKFANVWGD